MRRSLAGRVVDELQRGLPDLVVVAWEEPFLAPDRRLAATRTDAAGDYRFELPAPLLGGALGVPPLRLEVLDAAAIRPLARLRVRASPDGATEAHAIAVRRRVAAGWTVCDAEGEPQLLSAGNEVDALLDGDAMFGAMEASLRAARRRVHLLQLLFSPSFVAAWPDDPRRAPPRPFVDAFLAAARRGVEVRILLNENAIVPDTFDEIRGFFRGAGAPVAVRRVPMTAHVVHAKILLVDDEEAFLLGPPFEQKFWDTPRHLVDEPRRRTGRPTHDVSLRVRGPAVADVAAFFRELWLSRGGDPALSPPKVPPPAGRDTVQIARTLPRGLLPGAPEGEAGILDAYRRAFAGAQRFLYLENQYFTSPSVVEGLRAALARGVEVILVLNEDVDIPTYVAWQEARLRELSHPRVGVFTLWSPGATPRGPVLRPLYVHSKVALADDAWATVGAANLDSISLESAAEFGPEIPPNVEVNAVVHDGVDGSARTGWVRRLRERLWQEHLGAAVPREPPPGGWLDLWRTIAEQNLARASRGRVLEAGRVLPYRASAPTIERVTSKGP